MDIQQLKLHIHNENKIEQILTDLGCHSIKDKGDFISCGNPDGDNKSSVIIYKCELLNVNNYTRKISESDEVSDLLTLCTFYKKQSNPKHKLKDTIIYLHKLLNLPLDKNYKKKEEIKLEYDPLEIFRKVKRKVKISRNEELEIYDESIFHDIIPLAHISLIRERGILPSTCEEFGVGYSLKHKRITLPERLWCGDKNSWIGIMGRTTNEAYEMLGIDKFLPIGKSYSRSLNLYGLNENYEYIQKAGYVTVVESPFSLLRRASRNDRTCVSLGGKKMSQEQARILISLEVPIVIVLDKDVPLQEIKDTCKHFKNIRPIYYMYDTTGKILKDKESPCDLVDSEYRKMFENRIKY